MSIIFDALQKTQQQRSEVIHGMYDTKPTRTSWLKLSIVGAAMLAIFTKLVIMPILSPNPKTTVIAATTVAPIHKATHYKHHRKIHHAAVATKTVKPATSVSTTQSATPAKVVAQTAPSESLFQKLQKMNPLASNQSTTATPATPATAPNLTSQSVSHHLASQHHLTLNGILVSGSDKIAMINNHPLQVGESLTDDVSKVIVTNINEHSVQLKDDDHTFTVKAAE